ncbi:hypothetical protein FJQ54_05800 [Sandaracinobacter neustonicus]|uniref:Uncharacterized protein n=1 Tax=Sandaracinobacter neustonicus TaxID=1715348 RepID=A0A501XPY9_9SPHN|nr:hypothetical protein [Sandaracinobacter neustonicus]TPE62696.1 hypothetical protein FJQ54_05800 [Sandaracinobacter neustonicus]
MLKLFERGDRVARKLYRSSPSPGAGLHGLLMVVPLITLIGVGVATGTEWKYRMWLVWPAILWITVITAFWFYGMAVVGAQGGRYNPRFRKMLSKDYQKQGKPARFQTDTTTPDA